MKKAFVFDTNFIMENINLTEVVSNLGEDFNVYVSRVSIDERLSQRYLDLKKRYDKATSLQKEYGDIARITMRSSFDDRVKSDRKYVEQGYVSLFGDRIIPFAANEATFQQLLDRVFKKLPPFSSVDGASDKGFKDTLLWISLMQFFKNDGEDEIIFITNDNGFRKSSDILCAEFNEVTKKTISINENGYYKYILDSKTKETERVSPCDAPLPDVDHLRPKIQETIEALCGVATEDYWGNQGWERTFTLNKKIDSDFAEFMFSRMKQVVSDHIFELEIPADQIIEACDEITPNAAIPLSALEGALTLYDEIRKKLPDYLPQFFNAVASILNSNFSEPKTQSIDDDDLPF